MNPSSSTVSVAGIIYASHSNNMRSDIANSRLTYYTSAGSLSAYTVTVDSQITTYSQGLMLEVKVNHTNTGSATLNVNSYGAKTIKKNVTDNLDCGDLVQNQIARFKYDGTNFQYIKNEYKGDYGDGSDGILNVTSGTTSLDASSANVLVKNYQNINIATGSVVDLSNKASDGTVLILKSRGDVNIWGNIHLTGDGANKKTNGYGILDDLTTHRGDDGAVGSGAGGAGGTDGDRLTNRTFYITPDENRINTKTMYVACGSGGGDGGDGENGANGGNGGKGGGALIIKCGGALNFRGTINVNGENGSNGSVNVAGGGGGGGGATGMALIIYETLTTDSGTINAKGGAGGDGGGNTGGGTGVAGGGGGAGGGAYTQSGRGGGNGSLTTGSNGTATNTGAGAGGGGGAGNQDANFQGGDGGSQGDSDANHYLVVQNSALL